MGLKRSARHVDMPPPRYHPQSDSITLAIHYDGVARHVSEAMYVRGSLCKFDYIMPKEMCFENLNAICDTLIIERGRRFYIIMNKGFKLLIDNKDLKTEWMKVKKLREMHIYVEVDVGDEVGEEAEGVEGAEDGNEDAEGGNDEGDEDGNKGLKGGMRGIGRLKGGIREMRIWLIVAMKLGKRKTCSNAM
ncbi:hypothetical protein Salat_0611100 [Sesamum alatum]|uniref:Uncharacterized protein n=1 Tax=Sesamum alatum TaxID=300844 RepID=A0AAE1YR79_9LAMI|nr:hypothetical protein Salat_0611100 [Sesamum alatum]